jgi:peptidyl-prolyl cis-trans isomerase SurA
MRISGKYLLAALVAAIVLTGPSLPVQAQEQKIEILVNETPISAYDIMQRTRLNAVTTRQKPNEELKKKSIEELISEAIQLQEAKKNGIIVPKEDIDKTLDGLAKRNNMTGERLTQGLAQLGVNIRTLRNKFEAQLAWREVVRAKFRSQVSVGNAEVDRALSDETSDDSGGEKTTVLQLQRVRLEMSEGADQPTIAKRLIEAGQLRERVTSCEQIENAIKSYSRASVKSVGRKPANELPQPSRALLTVAKTGQLTPAYVTPTGVELYAVCGRHTIQADNSKREEVERKLMGEQFEVLAVRHLRDLRQEAYIDYR